MGVRVNSTSVAPGGMAALPATPQLTRIRRGGSTSRYWPRTGTPLISTSKAPPGTGLSVAGGIARSLNADVTLVRAVIAALAIFTGAGAALYLAAWLLIPADGDEQSIAAAWIASRQDRFR